MDNKVDSKQITIIILTTIILIGLIGLIFYINLTKDTSIEVEGTIKFKGDDYIIVSTDKQEEYLIKPSDDFKEGDKVLINIDNIDNNKNPKEAELKKIKLLSRSVTFTISDPIEETDSTTNNSEENKNNDTNTNNKPNAQTNTTTNNQTITIKTEEDIVSHFERINRSIDNNKTLTEELKNGFVSIIDFIFYDKEIAGYTFSSLTTKTKLKILEIALSIDEKIETKFPNYKENISSKYQNIKAKVVEKYLDITANVCTNNEETCQAAKEGLSDLKENFSITWSFIKEIAGSGLTKLKSWYEVWRTT